MRVDSSKAAGKGNGVALGDDYLMYHDQWPNQVTVQQGTHRRKCFVASGLK